MCRSPDEMSDDRLREAADYYRRAAREDEAAGLIGDARRWDAKADKFEELLAERETQRATDVEEIFATVVVDSSERPSFPVMV